MEITIKGSETEITDFILMLQNRKIIRGPYANKPDFVTVPPDILQSGLNTLPTPPPIPHKND
ncbi:MAG: hypothetical protein ACI4J7_00735 [Ruminiclostridium sp.]